MAKQQARKKPAEEEPVVEEATSKIVMVDLKDLKPYEKNPKQHTREQVAMIAESIKAYGFRVPILIGKDNEVIAGHGRRLAAKKLRMKTVPAVLVDDLSDEQIRAFRIADNKVGEGDWLIDTLGEELAGLTETEGMYSGFDTKEKEDILEAAGQMSFLDGFIAEAEASGVGGADGKIGQRPPDIHADLVGVRFFCDDDQQAIVMKAIAKAKSAFSVSTVHDAVHLICADFLEVTNGGG